MFSPQVEQRPQQQSAIVGGKYDNLQHQQLIDGIPVTYILEKLHQLGPRYYGDKLTAFAELHVEGLDKFFYVHEEYLVLQSLFFREVFENVNNGDIITICLPSPETFEPLLEFLYNGDADKWYDSLTVDNYYDVHQNIKYLGLGPAAQAVVLAFYQHEIEPLNDNCNNNNHITNNNNVNGNNNINNDNSSDNNSE
ncbi:3354_t:CDS:1 [Cetraspora pellucida]|uniref:3354_t:CDS:1 n=1 Tax=Cetraspora pellucida TaxID=1433469 RepID=A0ACA9KV68_9GLOM|nr:3354_t:CDS:1 [Cetraspora pellucida]